jgi:crossover junction endodeoxyribonuclease RuvC
MQPRRILGLDPGTRVAGWGMIEIHANTQPCRLGSGVLKLGSTAPLLERLVILRSSLAALLREWQPDLVSLEGVYIGRNARSALRLGEARGVMMVTVAEAKVDLLEVPPALVKRRVAGSGNASKEQVAVLVATQLGIEPIFSSFDESDSLAIALCAGLEKRDGLVKNGEERSSLPPGAALQ